MSFEQSELFQRIQQSQEDRRRAVWRVVTQAAIVGVVVLVCSLALTALLVVITRTTGLMLMAVICVSVTMTFTVIGMFVINLWNVKQ